MTNEVQNINQNLPMEYSLWGQIATKANVARDAMMNHIANKISNAKKGGQATASEMIEYGALCVNSGLNPLTSEVAPLVQGGHVSLIVSVDGWMTIANSHSEFDGIDWVYSEETEEVMGQSVPKWIEVLVFKKNSNHPFKWRTYYKEALKATSPVWKSMPNHMLQVRALANSIKRCFGLTAYTPEEAQEIQKQEMVDAQILGTETVNSKRSAVADKALKAISKKKANTIEQKIEQPQQASIEPAPYTEAELQQLDMEQEAQNSMPDDL